MSSTSVSTTSRGLLRRMEEEAKTSERQGIGSILRSEPEKPKTAASLRRTLSADMSSRKWFGRHGFTPLKKTPSSESFSVPSPVSSDSSSSSSSSEGEEDEEKVGQFDNWSPIFKSQNEEQQKKEDLKPPGLSDIWGSILSQKAGDSSKSSSAPYIHPLVKRSKSSLSQKSLEICTESLGSETGAEGFGFSSFPSSETGDFEDKSAEEEQTIKETEEMSSQAVTVVKEKEDLRAPANYNSFAATRKSPPRSFPPPLPSLSRREGPGFLMQSHRRDGRLVLEAVPVSSYNYFHAERQGGCLRLSFMNKASAELMEIDDEEEEDEVEEELELEEEEVGEEVEADVFDEFQGFEEDEETEEVEEENNGVQVRGIMTEVMNVHRSAALLTNKRIGLTNKNPTWSLSRNKNVDLEDVEEEEEEEEVEEEEEEVEEDLTQLPQSLPCPPRVARLLPSSAAAAAASFNAYDYFWRTKPAAAAAAMHPLTQQRPSPSPPIIDNNNNNYHSYCYPNKHKNISFNNKIVISDSKAGLKLRGNEVDFSVPPMRGGCKEPKSRSLFIWQPTRCIATS